MLCKCTIYFVVQMKLSLTYIKFLKTTVIKKINSFLHTKTFQGVLVYVVVFCMLVLSLRLMIHKNAVDVNGDSLETLLVFFLTLFNSFHILVISLVPT